MCNKTKVAGIGTVALPNRQADSEAGGSGAAVAEGLAQSDTERLLECSMNSIKNSF